METVPGICFSKAFEKGKLEVQFLLFAYFQDGGKLSSHFYTQIFEYWL